LGGFGKCVNGASGGKRGVRGWYSASQVAGAAAGSGCAERREVRYGRRATYFSGRTVREMAVAGCVCFCGGDSAHQRGKVQENCAARTICRLEMGNLIAARTKRLVTSACDGGIRAVTFFP